MIATFYKTRRPAYTFADLRDENRESMSTAEVAQQLRAAFPDFHPWDRALGCQRTYAERSGGMQFVLWLRDVPTVDHVHFEARGGRLRPEREEFVQSVCDRMGWAARIE